MDLVSYLQKKLDELSPNLYIVSKERNVDSALDKHEVVVSALSGNIYSESSTIPYQIDITTTDIDKVMADFVTLAKNNNEIPYTEINGEGENFHSETLTPFFNSPVVMEKDIPMGSNHYARIVVFATVNSSENVNDIKHLRVDGEKIEILTGTLTYVVESVSNRVSGQELNKAKKKASTVSVSFNAVNKASVFLNKAFKVSTGALPGNTAFNVNVKLDNELSGNFKMFISSYSLNKERTKLPSVNIGMLLYDDRGDNNNASS